MNSKHIAHRPNKARSSGCGEYRQDLSDEAAVTGAGTHYRFISRRTSTSRWSGWKLRSNRLVSSNVRGHGVRHNKYIQRLTRSRRQMQTQYQAKYVG